MQWNGRERYLRASRGCEAGRELERWQYEISGGGRTWYVLDVGDRTVWITYAGTGHPKATD
ncbi:hypothetical protein [Kitasatospora herbaricolor]|uniref:Uncharacterized protein n=1 Tax=Kitasatospora herbaricolor TaxID=68217 RepID=A0ABZ1WCK5_9ACTN|nr:hypothetical protein [Kitasatospora herbaricolor]